LNAYPHFIRRVGDESCDERVVANADGEALRVARIDSGERNDNALYCIADDADHIHLRRR